MPKALLLALSNPVTGSDEAEFNHWYNTRHVTDVLREVDGVVACTRYKITELKLVPDVPTTPQRYLALYEIEAHNEDDLAAVVEQLRQGLSSGNIDISPALDMATAAAALALPLSERRTT